MTVTRLRVEPCRIKCGDVYCPNDGDIVFGLVRRRSTRIAVQPADQYVLGII